LLVSIRIISNASQSAVINCYSSNVFVVTKTIIEPKVLIMELENTKKEITYPKTTYDSNVGLGI
jgi:hypothetical protein